MLSYSKYRTACYWGYERVTDIAIGRFPCTELIKKRKQNFPRVLGNSDWIGCKVVYEEGFPNI